MLVKIKNKPRQPITSKLVADLLTVAGNTLSCNSGFTCYQIQGFFDIYSVDEYVQALPLISNYFKKKIWKIFLCGFA